MEESVDRDQMPSTEFMNSPIRTRGLPLDKGPPSIRLHMPSDPNNDLVHGGSLSAHVTSKDADQQPRPASPGMPPSPQDEAIAAGRFPLHLAPNCVWLSKKFFDSGGTSRPSDTDIDADKMAVELHLAPNPVGLEKFSHGGETETTYRPLLLPTDIGHENFRAVKLMRAQR